VLVRDLPIAGTPTELVWAKRTWRCPETACPRRSWPDTSPRIAPRASLTDCAHRETCRRVGEELDAIGETARTSGVRWACAQQAVIDHRDTVIAAPDRLEDVAKVGVDEHTFQHANAKRRTW
jgi:hypothetical protein